MGFYLLDHPNPHGPNYYTTRRGKILAYVIHITAGLEDLDTVDDHSAENTARYAATTDRSVSWHRGSDTDSGLELLPTEFTAFQVVGYNSTTIGHEISKKSPDWRPVAKTWIEKTLDQAARLAGPALKKHGIPIRHATKAELDLQIARGAAGQPVGLIGHAPLDPTRRLDPGIVGPLDTFPWSGFLEKLAPHSPEVPPMFDPFLFRFGPKSPSVYLVAGDLSSKHWVRSKTALAGYQAKMEVEKKGSGKVCAVALVKADGTTPEPVAAMIADVPTMGAAAKPEHATGAVLV